MKTKFSGILTLLLAFVVQISFAQEKTISGTVVDESNMPLPGATVLIKGTASGTSTDFDGNYSIKANQGDVLEFSYVGYENQDITIGASNTVNVSMSPAGALDEVVITAQGIKKEKKALGYAVTQVSADELEAKAEGDIGRLLKGKAPGVRVTSTGGVAGSGTNIIIRGYSSISGNNQPLFIVDGVPFDSSTNSQTSFVTSANQASRFGDLDPNSIASISVLKGLSATALYGEEGKNGVILITTKGGTASKKKTEITVNQTFFVNSIVLPDYQDTWGNGFFNDYGPFFSNWGNRFADQATIPNSYKAMINNIYGVNPSDLFPGRTDLDADNIAYRPYDSQEDFFKDGTIQNTSVSIASGNEKGGITANYSYLEDKSFVPGNTLRRNTVGLGGNYKLSNRFTVSGKLNYAKSDRSKPMTDASFGSDVFGSGIASVWNVLYLPRSVDLMGYPSQHPVTGESLWYRTGNDRTNPLWVVNNTVDDNLANRVFGNMNINYNFAEGIDLSYRFGLDYYTEEQIRGINRGAADGAVPNGFLSTTTNQNWIYDHTLLFNVDKNLMDNLNLTVNSGLNLRRNEFVGSNITSERQLQNQFGLLNHSAFQDTTNGSRNISQRNNVAVYASATLGWDRYLFLNLSGRNDWSSTFQKDNRSIFSYGGSLSFIATDAFESLKSDALNYLKFRVGYGQAPGFTSAYVTVPNLGVNAEAFSLGGTTLATNSIPNFLPNPDLKPEISTEFEVGVEAKFFNNRLGFDFTYYNKDTQDQINFRPIPAETGFTTFADNFGNVTNEGIELGFNAIPYKSKNGDFTWDINGSYNINENLVENTDGQVVQISGFGGGLGNYAIEGEAFGIIQGSAVLRDANGNMLIDDNGDYIIDPETRIIGDPNPDWTMSIVNGFTYKNWNLTAQVEYQHGGDMFARTANTLAARGLTTDTDFDRYQSFILPGVVQSTGQPNNINIAATEAFFDNYGFGAQEFNIYDVTNIRLREVSLTYNLPEKWLNKTPFGRISIAAQGYNLFVKAVNMPDGVNFDPDINSVGVGNGFGFDFLTSWNSRRYGLSLKATF